MFGRITERAREAFFLEPQIYFNSRNEMIIENCKRIEECTEVLVSIVSGKLGINIWGSELRAYNFNGNGLIIRGRLSKIEFTERGTKSR